MGKKKKREINLNVKAQTKRETGSRRMKRRGGRDDKIMNEEEMAYETRRRRDRG